MRRNVVLLFILLFIPIFANASERIYPIGEGKVYDGSAQYVGELIRFSSWEDGGAEVFIPSLGIEIRLVLVDKNSDILGVILPHGVDEKKLPLTLPVKRPLTFD